MADYSLVIGSEAFDNIIKNSDGEVMVDRFLDLMPWNQDELENDRITVVVTYRAPRVKHLLSIWRETKRKNQTFRQWVIKSKNALGAIDSLGLAEIFLKKGIEVVLADLGGISAEGYDISNIVACEVLNATCIDQVQLEGSDPPLIMNTKSAFNGHVGLDQEQLDLMDTAMRMYDCKYAELFTKYQHSNKLRILHDTSLLELFKSCEENKKQTMERSTMKSQLVCIAEGKDNCIDR